MLSFDFECFAFDYHLPMWCLDVTVSRLLVSWLVVVVVVVVVVLFQTIGSQCMYNVHSTAMMTIALVVTFTVTINRRGATTGTTKNNNQ